MGPEAWIAGGTILAAVLGTGGIVQWIKVKDDRRAGVAGEERAAKRDMIADRDGIIATLLAERAETAERLAAAYDRTGYVERDNLTKHLLIVSLYAHIARVEQWALDALAGKPVGPLPERPIISGGQHDEHTDPRA